MLWQLLQLQDAGFVLCLLLKLWCASFVLCLLLQLWCASFVLCLQLYGPLQHLLHFWPYHVMQGGVWWKWVQGYEYVWESWCCYQQAKWLFNNQLRAPSWARRCVWAKPKKIKRDIPNLYTSSSQVWTCLWEIWMPLWMKNSQVSKSDLAKFLCCTIRKACIKE